MIFVLSFFFKIISPLSPIPKKIPSKIITFGTKKDKNQRLDIVYFNLYTNQLNQIFKIGDIK